MDYRELFEKYNVLLEQVDRLTKENIQLKAQLGLPKSELIQKTISLKRTERKIPDDESAAMKSFSGVDTLRWDIKPRVIRQWIRLRISSSIRIIFCLFSIRILWSLQRRLSS